jgi:hypothetical protein
VNVNAPSVRTSLVCGCHFSVAAVIAYTAFFPLHVSTACSDRHNNNNTNAHFGYVHHLNNITSRQRGLIKGSTKQLDLLEVGNAMHRVEEDGIEEG